MAKDLKFRDLRAEEIDCRVQSMGVQKNDETKGWARCLLYKDARVDMNVLDETVGSMNWQRKHEELKDNMYCAIGINMNFDDMTKEPCWVWKQDCGAESFTEKEKGEASDSFKRAGFNWGIGRELYTKIPIMIYGLPVKGSSKGVAIDGSFEVEKIVIEKKEIVALSLFFVKGAEKTRCFVWQKDKGVTQQQCK